MIHVTSGGMQRNDLTTHAWLTFRSHSASLNENGACTALPTGNTRCTWSPPASDAATSPGPNHRRRSHFHASLFVLYGESRTPPPCAAHRPALRGAPRRLRHRMTARAGSVMAAKTQGRGAERASGPGGGGREAQRGRAGPRRPRGAGGRAWLEQQLTRPPRPPHAEQQLTKRPALPPPPAASRRSRPRRGRLPTPERDRRARGVVLPTPETTVCGC